MDKEIIINEINNIKIDNPNYNKIIICSFFLPIEIKDNAIYPLSEYIYPNLYQLYKNNSNIYYIGFIKNINKISEQNKAEVFQKLKNEYKMYPIEMSENFYEKILKYFNEFVIPFINDVQINISKIKNNDINNLIEEIHLKFNQIVCENIINIANKEKILLMLFDYYFIFVPQILKQKFGDTLYNNLGIQYIFMNKMCSKDRFLKLPYYKNIVKSILCSNIMIFPSYYNCFQFLNLTKLIKEFKYKVNIEGDIIMDINFDEENEPKNNHKLILKVENIFPDYELLKSILKEKQKDISFQDIEQKILNLKKKGNYFIFLSIDDIKYLPFIKIKLLGIKLFIENILDEKYKISFIQVITGEYNSKKEKTNNINSNININEEKKELEKDNNKEIDLADIISLINEINSNYQNKIIEFFHIDINFYEKLYLLNNADCFIKTIDDINSPFLIYEYLMTKIIQNENILKEENKNINNEQIIKDKKISDYPIVEYIIGNQIKEVPGLNKYIAVNPYDIKNIYLEISRAFRNLINSHKNINNNNKEHSKKNDFNYIHKYFDIEKIHYYKFNEQEEKQISKDKNTFNKNEKLIKIDTNNIIKQYEEIIFGSNQEEKSNLNKIIIFNLDFFTSDKKNLEEENANNKKLNILLTNIMDLAINDKENKILLYSNKDKLDVDNIINKYIEANFPKYESSIPLLNNVIFLAIGGYFFKKLSHYKKEGETQWIKIRFDSEGYHFNENEILNTLISYKKSCTNLKIEQKSNKIFVYNDECNKEQVDLYIEDFKNSIDDNFNNFLIVDKIKNGYCITNILNYKSICLSKVIKELITLGKKPKIIICFGFNKTDEILYDFFDTKKKIIEKYIKEEAYIYCVKLIKSKNSKKNHEESNNSVTNDIITNKHYNNLYFCDNIDEILSLFKNLVDLKHQYSKK